jgi:hypothetical protein
MERSRFSVVELEWLRWALMAQGAGALELETGELWCVALRIRSSWDQAYFVALRTMLFHR